MADGIPVAVNGEVGILAFRPYGGTESIAATTVSANALMGYDGLFKSRTVRVYNAGAATVFLRFGGPSVVAVATDMPIPTGIIEMFRPPRDATHVAAITSAATATVYVTTGEGT